MDYLTSGNACLKEGASLIEWGAFFTSLGWVLLGFLLGKFVVINRWLSKVRPFRKTVIRRIITIMLLTGILAFIIIGLKKVGEGGTPKIKGEINRWLSKVKPFRKTVVRGIIAIMLLIGIFAFIIIGLIKIGKGGTLTTEGWNLLRVHSQRQNLIRSVVQEWIINDIKMKSSPLTGQVGDSNYFVYSYPMFRTSALNAFLTSGLWNYGEPNENQLLTAVSNCETAIASVNQFFDSLNTALTRNISVKERIDKAVKYQSQTLQSQWYSDLKVKHEKLRKLLATEYRWAMLEQMDPNTIKALLESEKGQPQNQPSIPDKH
jgi:hypothetical protein